MNTLEMHTLIWIIQKIVQSNDRVSLGGRRKTLKNADISSHNLHQVHLCQAHILTKQRFTSREV